MWYGSGTIAVTADGNNATGTGTQFLGNVRVGDGIAIQGSASLHEVTGVTSNTQLTFAPPYAGPAGSGKAFRVVPVLGYDKDLSDAFNALRLQFGDQLSNLQPWATAPTASAAMDGLEFSAVGKSVATGNAAAGRTALGLGTSSVRDTVSGVYGVGANRVLLVGSGGWLGQGTTNGAHDGFPDSVEKNISCIYRRNAAEGVVVANASTIHFAGETSTWGRIRVAHATPKVWVQGGVATGVTAGTGWTVELKHDSNTTVDANGFLKSASPIINLYSDRITSNGQCGAELTRVGTGHYQLTGTNGLRLDDGWYIETPHDRNKSPYFNIDWEQDIEPETDAGVLEEPADVTLTIRCYERVWNPQTGTYDNGDPVDIPDGRWIDLRLNEVRQPEPEMLEEPEQPVPAPEPAEPYIPSVVTMAQAKLALHYAGMLAAVEAKLNELPEPDKTTALIEWNHRQTIERGHPLVAQVAAALELTEQQLDELFVDAAGR